MTRKQWTLIVVAVLLGGLSLYLNRDWFAKDDIQIYDRSRPARGALARKRNPAAGDIVPITFGFNRRVKLTAVKVVRLCEIETNKYPHAIWHLISDSNSVPTKDFTYGERIPGMRPAVRGASPDPIEPGVRYRLFIEAGAFKGQHDFETVPKG